VITTDSRADLLAFARARLADEPSAAAAGTLREVLRLYESATEMVGLLSPRDSHRPRFEIAAAAYLNVIELYTASHRGHPDYRPEWHDGRPADPGAGETGTAALLS
jgi:hypothetical protein